MPNRHFLVKFWKCRKAVSILPHEANALLELFCLQRIVFGQRQNSSSSSFASWGKIKFHDFALVEQGWIGLTIFKNFADQDWTGFNFIGSGLNSDWKVSQSAHLCYLVAETSSFSSVFIARGYLRSNAQNRHPVYHLPGFPEWDIGCGFVGFLWLEYVVAIQISSMCFPRWV